MRSQEITESSQLTVRGSMTPDLVLSKLWLWDQLSSNLQRSGVCEVPAVLVLGSWTGTMGIILASQGFPARRIINIDRDPHWIAHSQQLAHRMGCGSVVEHCVGDVNDLEYHIPGAVIINTSTHDIDQRDWFDRIPPGSVVALQGRNATESAHSWDSLRHFVYDFPLRETWYRDQLNLCDPGTEYRRYMLIGRV